MPEKTIYSKVPQKSSIRNFVYLISNGRFNEIPKIMRRRFLNLLKALRRAFWKIFGVVYDHPAVAKRRQERQLTKILQNYYNHPKQKLEDINASKLNVALIMQNGSTYPKSSAFIRLIGPLTDAFVAGKIKIFLFDENTADVGRGIDICIVQRTAYENTELAKTLVGFLQRNKIPLIVDSDDAFNVIDEIHPEHIAHSQSSAALTYLLGEADEAWLSTKALVEVYPKMKQPLVVENHLDPRIWKRPGIERLKRKNTGKIELLYMGTATHDADFAMILPALDKVAEKFSESFRLTVIGVSGDLPGRPWIRRLYQEKGGAIYPKFAEWFINQGPFDYGLSPLVDSRFNNCKSDIKCLDYIAAGIVPVVSDLTPYKNKQLDDAIIRVGASLDDWYKTISRIVSNPEGARQANAQRIKYGQDYLWHKRSSEIVAIRLLECMEKLART